MICKYMRDRTIGRRVTFDTVAGEGDGQKELGQKES